MTTPRKKLQTAAHRAELVAARSAAEKMRTYIQNPGFEYGADSTAQVASLGYLLDFISQKCAQLSRYNDSNVGFLIDELSEQLRKKFRNKIAAVENRIDDQRNRNEWKRTVGHQFSLIMTALSEASAATSSEITAPGIGSEFSRASRQLASIADRLIVLARKAIDPDTKRNLFDISESVMEAQQSIPRSFGGKGAVGRTYDDLTVRLRVIEKALSRLPYHPEIPAIIKLLRAMFTRLGDAFYNSR